jgi:hypothetical protein
LHLFKHSICNNRIQGSIYLAYKLLRIEMFLLFLLIAKRCGFLRWICQVDPILVNFPGDGRGNMSMARLQVLND